MFRKIGFGDLPMTIDQAHVDYNVITSITIQMSSTANGVRIDANHPASAYGKKNAVNLLENALKKRKRRQCRRAAC